MNKRIFLFYLSGLVLTLSTELIRFNIIEQRQGPWISMTIAYMLFLTFVLFLSKIIKKDLLIYISFGIIGLLLEIFWLGQLNNILAVGIIGWIMWFTYWGSIAIIPKFFLDSKIDKVFVLYFFIALIIFVIFYFITKNNGATGLFFTSLNLIYIRQFLKNRK